MACRDVKRGVIDAHAHEEARLQAALQVASGASGTAAREAVDGTEGNRAYCTQRRGVGAQWKELPTELGVRANQLNIWGRESQSVGSKLQRVRVLDAPSVSSEGN